MYKNLHHLSIGKHISTSCGTRRTTTNGVANSCCLKIVHINIWTTGTKIRTMTRRRTTMRLPRICISVPSLIIYNNISRPRRIWSWRKTSMPCTYILLSMGCRHLNQSPLQPQDYFFLLSMFQ